MRILGIDPGLATIGFGIIELHPGHKQQTLDFGHIQTSPKFSTAERLNQIALDLEEICNKWNPMACAVEELFFGKNVTTGIKVAQARGVILQTLSRKGYPIFEYNPLQIKVAITSDGRATKTQIQKMVQMILGLSSIPKPDDAADALAIAICHANTTQPPSPL
jgi:crossover junction endodeoxyribonuclease RuvC